MYGVKLTGDKELLAALNRLSSKGMKDTVKRTLNRVSSMLQTEAKKNLRGVTKRSNVSGSKTVKGRTKNPLQKGITKKVWRNNEGATITILGDYRLKWFEKGTGERFTGTKKQYKQRKYTGRMNASNFFQRAISSKQQTVIKDINNELYKEIRKNFK